MGSGAERKPSQSQPADDAALEARSDTRDGSPRDQSAQQRSRPLIGLQARRSGSLPGLHRNFGTFFAELAEFGTEGYEPDVRRRLIVMNVIAYLIAITTLIYALQNALTDFETYLPVILINLGLVACALLVPFSHRFGEMTGGFIILGAEYIALFMLSAYLGRDSGLHLQYFIGVAGLFVVFGVDRWRMIVPLIAVTVAFQLMAWYLFPAERALIQADAATLDGLYFQASVTTGALIAAALSYAFILTQRAQSETERLLRNILPDRIVARLNKSGSNFIADSFSDATILFADVSGFVAMARGLGAARTVALLNELVTEFDALADRHGVEKIKTIGDAYMAAGGIPEPRHDHALRVANLACDMLETVKMIAASRGLDLNVRIGIASGPVMAGVIGTRKFSYDVWGDPVNLAARLENLSTPGRILVCPSCRDKLAAHFALEKRGTVDIKGVGPQQTFLVAGRLTRQGV